MPAAFRGIACRLRSEHLDEFYKNFTGVLLLLNPTTEFKGGKVAKGGMVKRYLDLLLPQKKLFGFAILGSVLLTILGIASSMFNKILMDEVLPYGLKSLLITLILVFSMVNITSTLIGYVRQWILIHLSIKIDIPLMLGYFGHVYKLPMKFFATRKTGEITTRYSDANTIKSVYLEPGEACALNAGYLLSQVLDVVRNGETTVAILDASAACHMPDVLEMPYLPPLLDADPDPAAKPCAVRLAGPTCLAGDVIGDYSMDAVPQPGQTLVFGDMAIYTTCKNNTFNGMPLPSIWLRRTDGSLQRLARFGYQDFKTRLGGRPE